MKSASSPTDQVISSGAPSAPGIGSHGRGPGPHAFEAFRDIPKSCICPWMFSAAQRAYIRMTAADNCLWHRKGGDR